MNPMDDREARALLGPLAGEPGGAQRLDVAEIVRSGDRRRRTRTIGTGALTAVALVAVVSGGAMAVQNASAPGGDVQAAGYGSPAPSGSAWPDPSPSGGPGAPGWPYPDLPAVTLGADCTVAPLPGPAGPVRAVDHTGRYAVAEERTGMQATAVVWRAGERVAEVPLPASARTEYWVNAAGEFAVTVADGQKNGVPYAYVDGKLTKLKGGAGYVGGISDEGTIVGGLMTGAPVVWKSTTAQPTPLPLPEGATHGQVVAIDRDGTIAGYANSATDTRAMFWLDGGGTREVPVAQGQVSPFMVGLQNGWVAGADSRNGYRYNVTADRYEKLPALGIRPVVVGGDGSVVSGDGNTAGVEQLHVISGGTARKLVQENPGAGAYSVLSISDDGRTVVGNQYDNTSTSESAGRALVWTCA